jgi:hypothetical protein
VSLPGVAELLRPVGPGPASDLGRQASGREAHPQKITVYLSADELLDLERARLTLRAHGIGVDRGRLVREAIAVLMMDLATGIDASVIARRLRPDSQHGPASAAPASGALANRTHDALVSGAFVAGAAASGAPGGGALVSGAPVNGAPVNGGPHGGPLAGGRLADAGLADGGLADGGPAASALAGRGPDSGVLAGGGLGDGAPAAAQ